MLILSSNIVFYHLHSFSALHLDILTSSHPHIFHLHICSNAHLIIFTSSPPHSFTSSPLHLIYAHLLIFASACLRIFSLSFLLSCPFALLPCWSRQFGVAWGQRGRLWMWNPCGPTWWLSPRMALHITQHLVTLSVHHGDFHHRRHYFLL